MGFFMKYFFLVLCYVTFAFFCDFGGDGFGFFHYAIFFYFYFFSSF